MSSSHTETKISLDALRPPRVREDAHIGSHAAQDLVSSDGSGVDRRVFVDPEIYQLEQQKIFAKCWLYVGHESELPDRGSFLSTTMAEDPVFVVRDKEGQLRAFLNSCTHRGAKVCRADSGSANSFKCPYHGWTFNTEGALISVPRLGTVYGDCFDRHQHGLREVPNVDSFGGMIFASWDPAAPTLKEYLGDMTFYLELMLSRMEGGTEVVGGVHKWTIDVNWKIPAENFAGDHYHVPSTHGAGVDMGYRSPLSNDGYCIHTGNGHSIGTERGGAQKGDAVRTDYDGFLAEMRAQLVAKYGAAAEDFVPIGVGTIFPNMSFMDTARFRTFRVWHPRGPGKIEIHSWCVVDKALPDELKAATRQTYSLAFGPSGIFEQDDGDIWQSVQDSMKGYVGRQGRLNYEMGLGREMPTSERYGSAFPGSTSDMLMTEANQRAFYRHYASLMTDAKK
ncbi:Rieske 2Fe-2S domain-containing protein [Cupriavidus pinatubonensis]|uniref:SRPBCC family protein n=1 Tax=Cupriavidus pinatubonensis TaxID=248026 RepID=UPI001C73B3A1|nr:SRPBCC family protein [Cupriavidus pinatubonensis]QYY30865.1 Rieske 2Fe-2S domain-containing protein [Cupriavidus pinatubonensis]